MKLKKTLKNSCMKHNWKKIKRSIKLKKLVLRS